MRKCKFFFFCQILVSLLDLWWKKTVFSPKKIIWAYFHYFSLISGKSNFCNFVSPALKSFKKWFHGKFQICGMENISWALNKTISIQKKLNLDPKKFGRLCLNSAVTPQFGVFWLKTQFRPNRGLLFYLFYRKKFLLGTSTSADHSP